MKVTVAATTGRRLPPGDQHTMVTVKRGGASEHYHLSPAQLRWVLAYMIDHGHTLGVLAAVGAMNDRLADAGA